MLTSLIHLTVMSVIGKYKKAHVGLQDSKKALDALTNQRPPDEITSWLHQAEEADRQRLTVGPDAMDIYETKEQQGICLASQTWS